MLRVRYLVRFGEFRPSVRHATVMLLPSLAATASKTTSWCEKSLCGSCHFPLFFVCFTSPKNRGNQSRTYLFVPEGRQVSQFFKLRESRYLIMRTYVLRFRAKYSYLNWKFGKKNPRRVVKIESILNCFTNRTFINCQFIYRMSHRVWANFQVRLGQVRLGQVRIGQVSLGKDTLGQVILGYLGQVGQVRLPNLT